LEEIPEEILSTLPNSPEPALFETQETN